MKLFTTSLIGQLDKYTIEKEPVTDVDLMERAALQISRWIENHFTAASKIVLFAGRGNNGGDALAIARQLADKNFTVSLFLLAGNHDLKGAPAANLHRLKEQGKVTFDVINHINDFPDIGADDIIVDGLFGSGLTRELTDLPAELVRKINALPNKVISIDMPSGLMGENNSGNDPINIIKANHTLTFQFPKNSFLLPGNEIYTGQWELLDIGLHPRGIDQTVSD